MGIRGELFSTRFSCEGRTYFFNVKENRNGDIFLSVVESKPTETETFDRRSIVVFKENMDGFMRALRTATGYMEKATQRPRHESDETQFPRSRSKPDLAAEHIARHPDASGPSPDRKPRRIVVKRKPQSPESSAASKSVNSD